MNDDLEGTWKEAVLAYLKWFPGICLEGLRKTTKQLSENIWCLCRYRTHYVQNTSQVLYILCMCVCMFIYVCMCICIMYVCMYACMYMYVCMYLCMYVCADGQQLKTA
jgi:hypothetical protein